MTRTSMAVAFGLFALACGSSAPGPAAPTVGGDGPDDGNVDSTVAPSAEPAHPAEAAPSTAAEAGPDAGPALVAAERLAFEQAKPVFEAHCAKCHVTGGKKAKPTTLGHFDMTSYPFGGHHAGEISAEVRKVLGIGGGKPTMPLDKPGAVKGDELALIAAWADAFDKAHAAGASGEGGHGEHKH
jgi:mono/diheme cytochrome c family protein